MKRVLVLGAISTVVVLVGCRDKAQTRDNFDDRYGNTTITSARIPVANEAAMARLIAARCDRETECSNIGPNKHYADRDVWIRAYPLGIDSERLRRVAASDDVAQYERELLARRREHLIIRVDRADLSKNVLRGFTSFD